MKKFLVLCILIACFFVNSVSAAVNLPEKTDREPVKLYLFYADYCAHCHELIDFFVKNYKDVYKDYFEIVTLEADTSEKVDPDDIVANKNVALAIQEEFSIGDKEFGWPLIVVGDYYHCGYGSATGGTIINQALLQYQKEDYEDIVDGFIKETENTSVGTLKDAAIVAGVTLPKEDEEMDTASVVIISVIMIVVIGGLVGLVFLSKKR